MQQSKQREVVRFDLAFDTNPAGETVPMEEIARYLLERVKDGLAVNRIESERFLMQITDGRIVRLPSGAKALALLFQFGDPDASDASLIHLQTRKVRHFGKGDDEARAVSAHLLFNLEPASPRGRVYRALLEKVTGLGQSRIRPELQRQLRTVFRDKEIPVIDIDGNERKALPRVELSVVANERLKAELDEGSQLGSVRLVQARIAENRFDPPPFAQIKRREMRLKGSVPIGQRATDVIRAVQTFARQHEFEEMYVEWHRPKSAELTSREVPNRAKIDVMNDDIGETLFAKRYIIELGSVMNDCVEQLRDDMITEMGSLLAPS